MLHATSSHSTFRARIAGVAPKAARYLAGAGAPALATYATREAASYLGGALDILDRHAGAERDAPSPDEVATLVEDLARARQRNGEYDTARALWERALDHARKRDDAGRIASIERSSGPRELLGWASR